MIIIKTDNGPATVAAEPTPKASTQRQFSFEWTGSDGLTWDLVRGPAYILSGARGFGIPTPQHHRRQSLGHGASHNGLRFPPREVYMPVEIETPGDMLAADRSFFAGVDPRATGSLRVTTPRGEWREIVCRYDEGAEGEYDLDPLLRKRAVYPIRMTAEDPFWRGTPIVAAFKHAVETGQPTRPGPPFFRERRDNLDDRGDVTNPGDVDVRAVWRVSGPFSSFNVGVNDLTVDLAVSKAAGEWVEIDMTAGTSSVVDETGADLRDFASDLDFPSIPVGTSELTTTVVGAGVGTEVRVSFVPRFLRAW